MGSWGRHIDVVPTIQASTSLSTASAHSMARVVVVGRLECVLLHVAAVGCRQKGNIKMLTEQVVVLWCSRFGKCRWLDRVGPGRPCILI